MRQKTNKSTCEGRNFRGARGRQGGEQQDNQAKTYGVTPKGCDYEIGQRVRRVEGDEVGWIRCIFPNLPEEGWMFSVDFGDQFEILEAKDLAPA